MEWVRGVKSCILGSNVGMFSDYSLVITLWKLLWTEAWVCLCSNQCPRHPAPPQRAAHRCPRRPAPLLLHPKALAWGPLGVTFVTYTPPSAATRLTLSPPVSLKTRQWLCPPPPDRSRGVWGVWSWCWSFSCGTVILPNRGSLGSPHICVTHGHA